mmetsp:Transcript_36541/g.87684  ORF Transcript_36541/g.87684 Transcript_36541/m.87684 type:complete len:215 (-) Transcript_36541:287-931(-)
MPQEGPPLAISLASCGTRQRMRASPPHAPSHGVGGSGISAGTSCEMWSPPRSKLPPSSSSAQLEGGAPPWLASCSEPLPCTAALPCTAELRGPASRCPASRCSRARQSTSGSASGCGAGGGQRAARQRVGDSGRATPPPPWAPPPLPCPSSAPPLERCCSSAAAAPPLRLTRISAPAGMSSLATSTRCCRSWQVVGRSTGQSSRRALGIALWRT